MTHTDVKAYWFRELELAVWGKVGNTMSRGQLQRVDTFLDAILSQPTDVKALIEKWRARAERHKKHGDCYRVGQGWGMDECADELEPVVQALEALRDQWRDKARQIGAKSWDRVDEDAQRLEACADELDAIIQ
jgi:hypothetical protein